MPRNDFQYYIDELSTTSLSTGHVTLSGYFPYRSCQGTFSSTNIDTMAQRLSSAPVDPQARRRGRGAGNTQRLLSVDWPDRVCTSDISFGESIFERLLALPQSCYSIVDHKNNSHRVFFWFGQYSTRVYFSPDELLSDTIPQLPRPGG